jgi:LuxR family maltose regulon positive regulatory protein
VSVERDQQNEQRFWCAVLDAIRGPARTTAPTAVPDVDHVIDSVLSEIAEHAEPVVLIIDDLHELRSTAALAQLEYFLVNLSSTARVVLSSRRDPPIKLHQLRLADALAEIRAGDLRFTEDETTVARSSGGADNTRQAFPPGSGAGT